MTLIFLYFLIFMFLTPLNKTTATPSFIMLSILFSYFVFILLDILMRSIESLGEIEYIGKKPIRYWLMMYIIFIIPLTIYAQYSKKSIPLQVHWLNSIIISLSLLFLLWAISKIIDYKTISD